MYIAFLTGTLILLVLANGGRYDWAYDATALALWLHAIPVTIALVRKRAKIFGLGPFFWILLIIVPWAAFSALYVQSLFNPSHQTIYNNLFSPLIPLAHDQDLPTTPNPARSLLFLQLIIGFMLMTLSVLITPVSRRALRVCLQIIFFYGTFLAAVGALMKLSQTRFFLWFFEFREPTAFATFFYKNHWAYFAILCSSIGIALLQHTIKEERKTGHLPERSIAYALCTLLILITIPLAEARGATLAAIPLALVFLYASVKSFLVNLPKPVSLIGFIIATLVGTWFMKEIAAPQLARSIERSEQQIQKYESNSLTNVSRLALFRDTWSMFEKKPLWGWGIGSFIHIHPIYAGPEFYAKGARYPVAYEFAHSDYLQSLAEKGIAGTALLITPYILLFLALIQRSNWRNPIGFSLMFGTALVLATASIDFTLMNPGVAMATLLIGSIGLRYSLMSVPLKEKRPR